MVRRRLLVPVIVLLSTTTACGGAVEAPRAASTSSRSPSSSPSSPAMPVPIGPSCPAASTSLEITAQDHAFDKGCLAVPAHRRFTVRFVNAEEGVPHNFAILSQTLSETFLRGKIITGVRTVTLRAKGLEAGEYLFHCELHPTRMNGTLVVDE